MRFDFFTEKSTQITRKEIIDFLYEHLDRFRDSKEAIGKCLDYVFSGNESKGGFVLCCLEDDKLVGVLVMIETGMTGYIPENFLVYVAIDASMRGKGIGSRLISKALENAKGDVALHVEYDNPAKKLYERLGFTSKYAEMRYQKGICHGTAYHKDR